MSSSEGNRCRGLMIIFLNSQFTCLFSSQMTSNLKETERMMLFFFFLTFHIDVNATVSQTVRTSSSSSYTPGFRRRTVEPLFRVQQIQRRLYPLAQRRHCAKSAMIHRLQPGWLQSRRKKPGWPRRECSEPSRSCFLPAAEVGTGMHRQLHLWDHLGNLKCGNQHTHFSKLLSSLLILLVVPSLR